MERLYNRKSSTNSATPSDCRISHNYQPYINTKIRFPHVFKNMQKLGLVLIISSFVPWLSVVVVLSFLPLSVGQKAVIVPILLIISELMFWLGLYFAGKELAQKYRNYFSIKYLWRQLNIFWEKRTQKDL
ncbi:MAG TPA: transporter suffix domain-containing protein [Nostocaceae cyanobacterium]|nr:transporter suffix domain-containing protein [Nostocaceae cyanobacterium]